MTGIQRAVAQLVLMVALLAMMTTLAWTGHVSATDTYTTFMVLLGIVGGAGFVVLVSTASNTNLVPHLVFVLLLLGAVGLLADRSIFSSSQVLGIVGLLLGGGAVATGNLAGPILSASRE